MSLTEVPTAPTDFDAEVRARNLRGARIAAALAALLMPTGIVMEYLSVPNDVWTFLVARVATAVACVGLWGFTYTRYGQNGGSAVLFMVGTACALCFEFMVVRLGGFTSGYYVGVIQIMLGIGVLATWQASRSAVACGILVMIWLVPALLEGPSRDPAVFMMHFYAILICAVIAVASSGMRYDALRRDNHARVALAYTSEQLVIALNKQKELTEAKTQFFQNVSHELRTPLTMILAPLPRMQDEVAHPRTLKDLSSIGRNADRLLRHIDELLDIAKLDSGSLRLNLSEISVGEVASRVVEASEPGAESKGLGLALEIGAPSGGVYGDANRVETILTNLVGNAIKYTPSGGRVCVSVDDYDDHVSVAVSDTGRGISSQELAHIFDRFYQAKESPTRSAGGVGIGLALAKELAELHGGTIEADSTLGAGTTFVLKLRKGRDHFSDETVERRQIVDSSQNRRRRWSDRALTLPSWRPAAAATTAVTNEPEVKQNARILVAEDEPDIRGFICEILQQEGYRVHAVADGREALSWAKEHQPDLILSDIMMPHLTGLELTDAIRSDPGLSAIPILLLTARSGVETAIAAYEQGVNDFISKPFHSGVLLARVRAQLKMQHLHLQLINQEKFASVGFLAAGIAHEVRNPLNAVMNAGRALREKGAPPLAAPQLLDVIVDGAKRIDAVVGALNAHARPSAGERVQVFSIREGIESTLQLLAHHLRDTEVEVTGEGRADVKAKPGALNQVFLNLIDNAVRSGATRIEIDVSENGGKVRVLISDNGPGVPAEVASRIFEPFFTTRAETGTGLGLNLSRRTVQETGGRLMLTNPGESGAKFVVELPSSASVQQVSA